MIELQDATSDQREQRGNATRARLLRTAVKLFGEKGFGNVSVRELAEHSQSNVAAIAYHFKDKSGLYREAFEFPVKRLLGASEKISDPSLSFEQSLRLMYEGFLSPLATDPELAKGMMKMHHREMVEPSEVLQRFVCDSARPLHQAVGGKLYREIDPDGFAKGQMPDETIQRLTCMLFGMAADFYSSSQYVDDFSPGLLTGQKAIEDLIETLVNAACDMAKGERVRRQQRK